MKILIVDDHQIIIDALQTMLGLSEGIAVVGTTTRPVRVLALSMSEDGHTIRQMLEAGALGKAMCPKVPAGPSWCRPSARCLPGSGTWPKARWASCWPPSSPAPPLPMATGK
jgi:hypothetical protein